MYDGALESDPVRGKVYGYDHGYDDYVDNAASWDLHQSDRWDDGGGRAAGRARCAGSARGVY